MDVFVHIPKSSGSTIRAILSREYGVKSILYFEPGSGEWKKTASSPAEFLTQRLGQRSIKLITGHHPFGVHSLLKASCRYFSMMRDPIDRVLSDYYYAFSYVHHRQREEIMSGKLSLEEFLTSKKFGHGSEQTAMLAGDFTSLKGPVQTAIANIRNCFAVVGTAERFDESILLIAKALGWKPPLYVMKNVTKLDDEKQANRAVASVRAHENYRSYFRDDYEVYRAADEHLSVLIEKEGRGFQDALQAFREIQERLSRQAAERIFELYEFQEDDRLPDFAVKLVGSAPYRNIEAYLSAGGPISHPGKNYVGRIDSTDAGVIAGWAGDLASSQPIHVTVWRSGELIGTASCNISREDLVQAGYKMSTMGFKATFVAMSVEGADYSVCFDDSSLCVPGRKAP